MKNKDKISNFLKEYGYGETKSNISEYFGDYYIIFSNGNINFRFRSSRSIESIEICSNEDNEHWYDLVLIKAYLYKEQQLNKITRFAVA